MLNQLKSFLTSHFPKLTLNNHELEQLLPRFESLDTSPEMSVRLELKYDPQGWQFGQMQRTGAALNSQRLFQLGEEGYEEFTIAQAAQLTPGDKVLSKDEYLKLCQRFQGKDELYQEALKAATIIQMITLSPSVRANADRVLGKNNYTVDSVEFLADTFKNINLARQIYPLVEALFQKYKTPKEQERLKNLLQNAFAPNQHFRHMLYTECNENGFQNLFEKIRDKVYKDPTDESYLFWVDFWLLNIAGFRGNLDPKGSIYLTHHTFQSFDALLTVMDEHFLRPIDARAMLHQYLAKRGSWLGVDLEQNHLNPKEQNIAAHIGAMMRLFLPEEGALLASAITNLPALVRAQISEVEQVELGEPTPTYVPALFANAIDLRKATYSQFRGLNADTLNGISPEIGQQGEKLRYNLAVIDAINTFLPFYLLALKTWRADRAEGKIAKNVPLCFKEVARNDQLAELFRASALFDDYHLLANYTPKIDEKGLLSFARIAPKPLIVPQYRAIGDSKSEVAISSSASLSSSIPSAFQAYQKPTPRKDP